MLSAQVSDVKRRSASQVSLTLQTDAIAPFVWLELPGHSGYFSDNGFIMLDKTAHLTYTSFQELQDNDVTASSFNVISLMDVYQ